MRYFFISILWGFSILVNGQDNYHNEIQAERDSINRVFSDPEKSILLPRDLKTFQGLPFYDIEEKYRVKCNFTKIDDAEPFRMQTSTTRLPVYKPYGVLTFVLDGKTHQLTVYQNLELIKKEEYKNYLFIPFTDLTSGNESYGGGRYLDTTTEEVESGDFYLDFNRCYNQYCAYNPNYSCPIPPQENHLDVEIRAGVKNWHH